MIDQSWSQTINQPIHISFTLSLWKKILLILCWTIDFCVLLCHPYGNRGDILLLFQIFLPHFLSSRVLGDALTYIYKTAPLWHSPCADVHLGFGISKMAAVTMETTKMWKTEKWSKLHKTFRTNNSSIAGVTSILRTFKMATDVMETVQTWKKRK